MFKCQVCDKVVSDVGYIGGNYVCQWCFDNVNMYLKNVTDVEVRKNPHIAKLIISKFRMLTPEWIE